jgi:hypothetical protein
MGIGPVYAIPMALRSSGITLEDVDLFEVGLGCSCVWGDVQTVFLSFLDQRSLRLPMCIQHQSTEHPEVIFTFSSQ